MQITTVKLLPNGYLVDGTKSIPNHQNNTDFIAVENWKLGKTHDWLLLEETFNTETQKHDNWLKIQSYDADLAQYYTDLDAYNNWVPSVTEPIRPPEPTPVPKPEGYFTTQEANDSVLEHNNWKVGYDNWVADTDQLKPTEYWIPEPIIKLIPTDIPEPTITTLPPLVPNTPEPQFTLEELKNNKMTELKKACNDDIESNFTSNAMGIDYEYESSLKDQINISGAAQANTTIDFTVIDTIGNKLRVSHNATQMQQVFTDGVIIMQTKKNKLYTLLSQVNSAVDEATVNAIVWV